MDRKWIDYIVKRIRQAARLAGKIVGDDDVKLWINQMNGFTITEFSNAMDKYISESRYMPHPSEIKHLMKQARTRDKRDKPTPSPLNKLSQRQQAAWMMYLRKAHGVSSARKLQIVMTDDEMKVIINHLYKKHKGDKRFEIHPDYRIDDV